jgi:hypothetical protein
MTSLNPAPQAKEAEEVHAFMQIDINNEFHRFGDTAFFKLLADFTDMRVVEAHVAVSGIPCDINGTSVFAVLAANANVGAGNTQFEAIPLNADNMINDVSDPSDACTYHVDVDGKDYEFPVTDIALANTSDDSETPWPAASATITAKLVEVED